MQIIQVEASQVTTVRPMTAQQLAGQKHGATRHYARARAIDHRDRVCPPKKRVMATTTALGHRLNIQSMAGKSGAIPVLMPRN